MNTDRFQIITPNDLEDYRDRAGDLSEACWPEFMLHDAMGNSLPFHWDKDLSELPEGGWDWVFQQATAGHEAGTVPNIQSAIQIAIHPDYQSQGLSMKMVQAMRSIGKSKGFQYLVAPVRPNQKSRYPLTSIDDYITWTNDEGLPFDAWLRVHARVGAEIIKPCHEAMLIRGTRL